MGCCSASVQVVNAEVDSMGGFVDGEVGIANKYSPHKAAIEKVQAELRQECGIRDERRRELDFLEKGGNPLEFKRGIAASVSVQSTSITNQHQDQFVTSEAKASLAITASPRGDSVESSGRLGTTSWDPNSADNLLLFDAENECSEGGRSLLRRSSFLRSGQSFLMDGGSKTREHRDSATFSLPRKAYKRRYRSRPNRDGARLSSTDVDPAQGCQGTSLPSHHVHKDVEVLLSDADNHNITSNQNSKPTCPSDEFPKIVVAGGQNIEFDGLMSFQSTKAQVQGVSTDTASDVIAPENRVLDELNQQSLSVVADTPKPMSCNGPEAIQTEEMTCAAINCLPTVTTTKVENQSDSYTQNNVENQSSRKIGDDMMTDTQNNIVSHVTKLLDSESSCTQASLSIDGNNDGEMFTRLKNLESKGNLNNQILQDGTTILENDKFAKEMKDTDGINSSDFVNKECASAFQSKLDKGSLLLPNKKLDQVEPMLKDKVKDQDISEGMEVPVPTHLTCGVKPTAPLVDSPGQTKETTSDIWHKETYDVLKSNVPEVGFSGRASTVSLETEASPGFDLLSAGKIDEDSILKEAQIIEAKRKRIAELSVVKYPVEIYQKSHWGYVLEEMTWLAIDFAQERMWKLATASQISYQAAVASWRKKQERSSWLDAKRVARTLAKVVMEFWHSIELQVHDTSKELEQHCQKNGALSVQAYAVRFLKCDKPNIFNNQAEVRLTPERVSDSGILGLSWEESLTEENLFYAIPPGAMETYRMAMESHLTQYERIGSYVQEEVDTSACDVVVDFASHDYAYDEEEGETNTYRMPVAFEGRKPSRYGQKKRKYGTRLYEVGSDMLPIQSMENKLVNPQFSVLAKRPGSNSNVSIPTKRMRTASRRVNSPFGAGATGCIQFPNKTDASSCDTNSFQDDQSILHGELIVPNSVELESTGEFDKQFPFDAAEVSTKPKKKKKAKHLNAAYEHRWQVESSFHNEQFQSHFQRRTEIHELESNGNNGLLGKSIAKKPKLMRHSQDNSFDNFPPSATSVPSPVGSQMSNMSNSNKFIKMLGGRDRSRKHKSIKMPSGQSGSGSMWSLFEDQALVVLAHDLGPNWELISDAFNCTLRFKYIFREAKECKVRHICLMDRSSGDGADSGDDSGSSQPYPSTLPGIPKGSARQLFQRLQGPMEEETLKSHFEKIIKIGQKQHFRKTKNDNQDPKLFQRPHSSHAIALSQVCSNNGGAVLTPLDLCDESISDPNVLPHGYQGAHSGGLTIPNQGSVTQMLPTSGATASPTMMIGNNFSSSPGSLNTSPRDSRYGFPRSGSLPADEHQRMHLYNQMIAGRNMPQSNVSTPGAVPGTDRGARMLSSGSGLGMMSVANRNLSIPRPGVQGVPSPSMVNSGTVVSPGMSSGNIHTGVGAGQGSAVVRPREAMNVLRQTGLPQDPQRQMMVSDLQTPGNSQEVSHFGGMSSSFYNQTTSPTVSPYPLHHQPPHPLSPQQPQVLSPHQSHFQGSANHASNSQQQAYASFRLAKERQLQHRFLQQQQQQPQQFAASNSLMSHVQPQPQLPISSSPMQNSPQGQPQTSSPAVSVSPLTSAPSVNGMPQHQQKHQMPTPGVARNAQSGSSGLSNQTGKPRPRQQQPLQASRQHPQQRQQLQAQQQAKVVKGVGRGSLMTHQNIPIDNSLSNGVSTNPGNQCLEKGEQATNSMQSQGLYPGSTQNSVQQSRQYTTLQSNQTLPQQKMYSNLGSSSSKHLQPTPQSDNSCEGHIPSVAPPVLAAANHPSSSLVNAGSNSQTPSQHKLVNQNQPSLQRLVQPNRQINSDSSFLSLGGDSDADHHPPRNFAGMDARTTLPQVPGSASNAAQVVSQPSAHKWHASEPLGDANSLNSPKSLVSVPSNSSESVAQVTLGHGQRLSTSSRHDTNKQWQQQRQSQQPHSPVPQPHQPQLHSQQQAQLLQGSGNIHGRSSDTRLE